MTRLPRTFAVLAFALFGGFAVITAGCSGQNPYQASESANSVSVESGGTPPVGSEDNVFTPEDANVSSCVGTMERPDCGSKSKGGWRIARSIKARDAVINAGTDDAAPLPPTPDAVNR